MEKQNNKKNPGSCIVRVLDKEEKFAYFLLPGKARKLLREGEADVFGLKPQFTIKLRK